MSRYELTETPAECPSCLASSIRTELWFPSRNGRTLTLAAVHSDCDCGYFCIYNMGQYLERKDACAPCEMWSVDDYEGTLRELTPVQTNVASSLLFIRGNTEKQLETFCKYAELRKNKVPLNDGK